MDLYTARQISEFATSSGAFVAAVAAAWHSWKSAMTVNENKNRIMELHLEVNHRMDELLKSARALSHSEGMREARLQALQSSTQRGKAI